MEANNALLEKQKLSGNVSFKRESSPKFLEKELSKFFPSLKLPEKIMRKIVLSKKNEADYLNGKFLLEWLEKLAKG